MELKERWNMGRREKGPLQAGTAGRHIGDCVPGLPQGRGGRRDAAARHSGASRTLGVTPGPRPPTLRPAGWSRAGRGVTASRPHWTPPPRSRVWTPRPAPPASQQLGRRRRPASSPRPAETGGWDAGGRVGDGPGPEAATYCARRSSRRRLGRDRRGPHGARRVPAPRARVPVGSPGGSRAGRRGSSSRGRAACCGGLAGRPGSQPRPGCRLGALEIGADSPFLARAESPGPARAGAWRLCLLTGSPGPGGWASPASRSGARSAAVDVVSRAAPAVSLGPVPNHRP